MCWTDWLTDILEGMLGSSCFSIQYVPSRGELQKAKQGI